MRMKKGGILVLMIIASFFFIWTGRPCNAREMKHDATAAKKLEFIRKNLSSLTEMKLADSKKYYEESLKSLNDLIQEYSDTEEALEARFFIGATYNEMHKYDEAIKCFDAVLAKEGLNQNFKARTLFFKAKALFAKGDVTRAREVVADLRLIEPRAADSFLNELGGMTRVGMDAPTFSADDFTGKPIDLAKYKGSIVVLYFWATWCEPCMIEFPKVKTMYRKLKEKGVQFIGISLDDDIGDLRGFVKQEEVEWPQLFDGKRWKGVIPGMYHVQVIPMMFLLDKESKIRYIGDNTESVTQIATTLLSESKELPLFR